MNKLERTLLRTRKTVVQACRELGLDPEDSSIIDIDQCSSCSIWVRFDSLREDLDGNPICRECYYEYGP